MHGAALLALFTWHQLSSFASFPSLLFITTTTIIIINYFLVNGYGTLHMSEADFKLELKKRSNLKSHGDSIRARKLRAGETTILKCLVWLWMCAGGRSFHVRSSLVSSPSKT